MNAFVGEKRYNQRYVRTKQAKHYPSKLLRDNDIKDNRHMAVVVFPLAINSESTLAPCTLRSCTLASNNSLKSQLRVVNRNYDEQM